MDTLILIPTSKICVFWYSGQTNGDINLGGDFVTTFIQVRQKIDTFASVWAEWRNPIKINQQEESHLAIVNKSCFSFDKYPFTDVVTTANITIDLGVC